MVIEFVEEPRLFDPVAIISGCNKEDVRIIAEEVIEKIPIPITTLEVIKLAANDDVDYRILSEKITDDPFLSLRIIEYMNKASNTVTEITTVQQFINLYGLSKLRLILNKICMDALFTIETHTTIPATHYKKKARKLTKEIMELASMSEHNFDIEELKFFTAVNSLDLLALHFSEHMKQTVGLFRTHVPLSEIFKHEEKTVGFTSNDVVIEIAKRLYIPSTLMQAVFVHFSYQPFSHRKQLALLHIARRTVCNFLTFSKQAVLESGIEEERLSKYLRNKH